MRYLQIIFILTIFLFFSSLEGFGQDTPDPCGTVDFESPTLEEWRANRGQIAMLRSNDMLYVKMKIHIVGTDDGNGYYSLPSLLESFCKLNEDMAGAGIKMEMDPDINYINSNRFFDHSFQIGAQMMSQHNVPNMVNCYIVDDPAGNCGYFSPSRDAVALKKSCLGGRSATWSHELGHFFSLPHTFSGWEGTEYEYGEVAPTRIGNGSRLVELADSSNCEDAGDGFCDTQADYLSFRWSCSQQLSPDTLLDPDSIPFRTNGINIMSYSNDNCQSIFSEEQASAMQFDITVGRSNHISSNDIPEPINFEPDSFVALEGIDEEVLQYDDATIRWKSIAGADFYVVELTRVLPFATRPDFEFFITDTFLTMDFLDEDFFYDWEVTPFHPGDGCSPKSNKYRFFASEPSSTNLAERNDKLSVFPNPVLSSELIQINYHAERPSKAQLEIITLSGQIISHKVVQLQHGMNKISMSGNRISSGMYLLQIRDENGVARTKVSVQ
jgi:hypothetical protein